MNLATVVDQLYGLPPQEFTAARDARAADARRAGDRDLAASVKRLRKPSTGAWMANMLVRREKAQIDQLIDLGEGLRSAGQLNGEQIRRASKQKADSLHKLLGQALAIAAHADEPVSKAAEEDLETTLDAAFADSTSAAALREGCLTSALRYSGLGFEVGVRGAQSRTAGTARGTASSPSRATAVEKARHALEDAKAQAKDAERELESARRAVVAVESELKRGHAALNVAERRATKARQKVVAAQKKVETERGSARR